MQHQDHIRSAVLPVVLLRSPYDDAEHLLGRELNGACVAHMCAPQGYPAVARFLPPPQPQATQKWREVRFPMACEPGSTRTLQI